MKTIDTSLAYFNHVYRLAELVPGGRWLFTVSEAEQGVSKDVEDGPVSLVKVWDLESTLVVDVMQPVATLGVPLEPWGTFASHAELVFGSPVDSGSEDIVVAFLLVRSSR